MVPSTCHEPIISQICRKKKWESVCPAFWNDNETQASRNAHLGWSMYPLLCIFFSAKLMPPPPPPVYIKNFFALHFLFCIPTNSMHHYLSRPRSASFSTLSYQDRTSHISLGLSSFPRFLEVGSDYSVSVLNAIMLLIGFLMP